MSFPYFQLTFLSTLAVFFVEQYLHIRQHAGFGVAKRPKALEPIVDAKTFLKAQQYGYDKSSFTFVMNMATTAVSLGFLYFGFFVKLYKYSLVQTEWLGYTAENDIIRSLIMATDFIIINNIIAQPFAIYKAFVIEERHGFNKKTWGLYLKDFVLALALTLGIGLPLLALLLWVIDSTGPLFWLYAWLVLAAIMLVLQVIFPTVIAPLFNTYTPLEEGELRTKVEALAKKLGFPLSQLYVIDGSKRSGHSNAFFYGMFTKYIVLYDTLLEQVDTDGIVAVLGHELGHWKNSDNIRQMVIVLGYYLAFFRIAGVFISDAELYRSFGFYCPGDGKCSAFVGLLLFSLVYSVIEHAFGFLLNAHTRWIEYRADRFADSLGYKDDLARSLIALHSENLSTMIPDPLYSMYHNSHPTLQERLSALEVDVEGLTSTKVGGYNLRKRGEKDE